MGLGTKRSGKTIRDVVPSVFESLETERTNPVETTSRPGPL